MTRRLLASYVTLTAVVLVVLVIPLGVVNARNEKRDLTAKVERDAQAVASLAEDALEQGMPMPGVQRLANRYAARTGGRVVVVDRDGVSVVDSASAPGRSFASRPELRAALAGDIATGTRASQTLGTDLLYVAVPAASGGIVHGAARITYPTATLDARVRRYWLYLAGISAVALGLAAILGVRLARWAAGPLVRLEHAAAAAGAGDLDVRAPVDGPPEVRAVATAFNETVAKLDALVTSQQAFVADASHQLRTPLTALRLRLENLEREVGPGGRSDLDAALGEVERLGQLVEALLVLARADAEEEPAGSLDLAAAARERVDAWSALAAERGVALEARAERPLAVRAGRARVEQVLDNLLSNALEASPAGGTVRVAVRALDQGVELTVSDEGPGMTSAERERAFDRFWRKRESPGTGLGLAIARRLVEADDGTIELREAPGGGTTAVVRLRAAA